MSLNTSSSRRNSTTDHNRQQQQLLSSVTSSSKMQHTAQEEGAMLITELSDLPDAVLEMIFRSCCAAASSAKQDTHSVATTLCLVCQRWRGVYERSSIPLPQLTLTAPLPEPRMQLHARKFCKVRFGGMVDDSPCAAAPRQHLPPSLLPTTCCLLHSSPYVAVTA